MEYDKVRAEVAALVDGLPWVQRPPGMAESHLNVDIIADAFTERGSNRWSHVCSNGYTNGDANECSDLLPDAVADRPFDSGIATGDLTFGLEALHHALLESRRPLPVP